ncbi:dipeptide epimerase [bacterium]|nr:dipeptide epimerase [bacterium]
MELTWKEITLTLRHPFVLSDSAITEKKVILVECSAEGLKGIGEATPSSYYGETPQTVVAILEKARTVLHNIQFPFPVESLNDQLLQLFPKAASARSAIIMAVLDWMGKKQNISLHKLLQIDATRTPITSFTIGIDQPEVLAVKILEAEDFPILKIKLGKGDYDYEILKTIRQHTDKTLRVDINEGWNKDEAAKKIDWLSKQNVELVEQPLPKENLDDMIWLHKRTALPVIADENILAVNDIASVAECFDGINIKLDKCGGLLEALKMIRTARRHNLKTMIGCMIQTSVGTTAMAHLSPLVDYADLDGHWLISNDPYKGFTVKLGRIQLPSSPGIGLN